MHRFYVPAGEANPPDMRLSGGEAHHALHVLRLKRGEIVHVLNGAGDEFICEVSDCNRNTLGLRVTEKRSAPAVGFEVTLVQALLKGKTFDYIVEKATELGAACIVPLITERTIARPEPKEFPHKVEKWTGDAIGAMKQCGTPWLPKVDAPTSPAEYLDRNNPFDLVLIASLAPGARHPAEHFRAFRDRHGRQPRSVAVWVGPEGDFSPGELDLIQRHGALPVTLGQLVLRADTAAVYCLSIIQYELTQHPAGHSAP